MYHSIRRRKVDNTRGHRVLITIVNTFKNGTYLLNKLYINNIYYIEGTFKYIYICVKKKQCNNLLVVTTIQ